MRTKPWTAVAAAVTVLWCAHAPAQARVLERVGQPESVSQVVEDSLPAVVLLLAHHQDGSVHYGAGLVVDDHGGVLTSLHVVKGALRVQALLHRRDAATYTPMDGGLSRLLFERHKELLPVTVEDQDVLADLARVRVAADTSGVRRPPWADGPAVPGETVLALGHPQENVWSFTMGVVGALRQGAIQHDALLSPGNSGGPLLNTRGQVLGINVNRIVSDAWGVSFARPVARGAWLVPGLASAAPAPSTLEETLWHCREARAAASDALLECVDWDGARQAVQAAQADVSAGFLDAEQQRMRALLLRHRRGQVSTRADRGWCRIHPDGAGAGAPGVLEPLGLDAPHKAQLEAWWMAPGSAAHSRVEEVALDRDGRAAWVRWLSREAGAESTVVERWVLSRGRWRQRVVPLVVDLAQLPAAWPRPAATVEVLGQALARRRPPAAGGSTPARTPSQQ